MLIAQVTDLQSSPRQPRAPNLIRVAVAHTGAAGLDLKNIEGAGHETSLV